MSLKKDFKVYFYFDVFHGKNNLKTRNYLILFIFSYFIDILYE